jgi:hypothetical protein
LLALSSKNGKSNDNDNDNDKNNPTDLQGLTGSLHIRLAGIDRITPYQVVGVALDIAPSCIRNSSILITPTSSSRTEPFLGGS